MSFLEFRNIAKSYGGIPALSELSLSINKGEFVTLLGPSGSGKTTLLKILAGFEKVSSGSVFLEGRDVTNVAPEARNFGIVFQGYALFPHMSVGDNVAYPLKVRGLGRAEIGKRVAGMLDMVRLSSFVDRKPAQLSGGQQQRVALARALVFKPSLLLLDESMSALDKRLRLDLQEELREIHQSLGTTFINVTHDQEEAMNMSDRIAVLNHGVLEQFATAQDLYRRPQSRFVADFVGKSNLITGEILRQGATPLFRSPALSFEVEGHDVPDGKVDLLIRPEDITLTRDTPAQGHVACTATVQRSTYSGDRVLYALQLGDGTGFLAYATTRGVLFERGMSVHVAIDPESCTFLPIRAA